MYHAHLDASTFDSDADALDAFAFATSSYAIDATNVSVAQRTATRALVAFDAARHDVATLIHHARVRVTRA